jgi:hypothetical protein
MYRYISRTLDDIITPSGSQSSSRAMQQCYDVQPSGVLDSLEQAYDSLSREVSNAALQHQCALYRSNGVHDKHATVRVIL